MCREGVWRVGKGLSKHGCGMYMCVCSREHASHKCAKYVYKYKVCVQGVGVGWGVFALSLSGPRPEPTPRPLWTMPAWEAAWTNEMGHGVCE